MSSTFLILSGVIVQISYPNPEAGSLPDEPMMQRFASWIASFSDKFLLYSVSRIAFTCVIPEPSIFQSFISLAIPSGVIS